MFNILLDSYWSQKKRILYTPFFWHSIGWVEIFIFIWSRNLSQEFHRDVLLKRKPNRCIVAFDEAKSKSIVAFWWSEIPIDVLVSSHFDEAKFKSIVVLWLSEIQIDVSSNLAN